jgi:decaprenyl-phosphate phosphoribosyltransferase
MTARNAASSRSTARALLVAARPRQWLKNVLVLAAPLFGADLGNPTVLADTAVAFVAFCLAASGIYLVNDAVDAPLDRRHPVKRHRPVAAGEVSLGTAYATGAVLLVLAMVASAYSGAGLPVVVGSYIGLSVAYCFWLKAEPVADIAIVASGFLLRTIAGGVAGGIFLSEWFLLAASFGSLFVAAGKRYAEAQLPENADGTTRPSLQRYSTTYLRFVWTLAASVLIMTYGLWAFELRELDDTVLPALSTAPFVLAVLRYAVVVDAGEAGEPEEILLRDRVLQALGVVWVVLVAVAVYG